ncbi:hypothetical protein RND81_02G009500 [Saponaria officinalis]|uniref:DNA-directed RNA polymerase n=1 Tax=Saponaria officinalis TaxID=3572 RepID=A0AAW1MU79_SAPOF
MLVSMKIQPVDGGEAEVAPAAVVKPVVMSRLKRLFRISAVEKDDPPPATMETTAECAAAVEEEVFEPSSVCLAKMVQNFIEESNEKQVRCGRRRCNCFNGDGSDGETDTVSAADICDYLKRLVVCASVNERNVVADTTRVVAEKNKVCKRKDELRKLVMEGLVAIGYNAAICKSKWEKSPSFPAGEYEYVDVIVEGKERLIIDIDFRSEFEVAKSTKTYKSILQTLPNIFVGKPDRLSKIICILSEAAKQSLKKKGMHIPPWRKADYVQAKWLSPPTRLVPDPTTVTPPPTPVTPVSSHLAFSCPSPNNPIPAPPATHFETHEGETETSEASCKPTQLETIFDILESSDEENVNVKVKEVQISPKKRVFTGLTSLMEDKP